MMNTLSNGRLLEKLAEFTYPVLDFKPTPSPVLPDAEEAAAEEQTRGLSEEQAKAREAAAHRQGFTEGQQRGRADAQPLIDRAKSAISAALSEFAREKENYFQDVESEVVSLALAVARKILYREAQVDPLVLKGVVRAALERLAAGTTARMFVPPGQIEEWKRSLEGESSRIGVEILEDTSLDSHACRIETELGNTHLNVETQLKEIEQGFADLLARAPRSSV